MELCSTICSTPGSMKYCDRTSNCVVRRNRDARFQADGCPNDSRGQFGMAGIKTRGCVDHTLEKKDGASEAEQKNHFMLLHEKVGNITIRRYAMDACKRLQIIEEKEMRPASSAWKTARNIPDPVRLMLLPIHFPQLFRDFFLPTDFPETVSHDYLRYMLWQLPTNITGWICSTLVTSSLLKAVGVDAWAGSTVAATAAIKWVSKDGLGAFGRLFIGGRFGRLFDDDPKQWRMYAEFIGSFGSIFELATPVMPGLFLPLASLGHLTKAVGRGLKDPSFRVIQNHFAIAGNMGEVSAKEEVWEVAGELLGIALGVILLATPGLSASYSTLILTWASIRLVHLWLRYQSLASLQFPTINFKRALIMAESNVAGSPIPGISECNNKENLLLPWQFTKPYLHLGCSLKDVVGSHNFVPELEALMNLYLDEQHVLVLHSNVKHKVDMQIIFKEGATSTTMLRAIWQAEWLMAFIMSQASIQASMPWRSDHCTMSSQMSILTKSLQELNNRFDTFLCEMENVGWDTSQLVLKIPREAPYLAYFFPTQHYSKNEKN